MNNDSVFLLKIALRADERGALIQLSRSERRDPRAQAALIIRAELERLGLLAREPLLANATPIGDTRTEGMKNAQAN